MRSHGRCSPCSPGCHHGGTGWEPTLVSPCRVIRDTLPLRTLLLSLRSDHHRRASTASPRPWRCAHGETRAWQWVHVPLGSTRWSPRGGRAQRRSGRRSRPGGIFPWWPAVVLGLARVLRHFPPRASSGRGPRPSHPPSSLRRASGRHRGLAGVSSCGAARQHPAASAGILSGSGEFSPPPALPLPLCFLAEASVPFHRR